VHLEVNFLKDVFLLFWKKNEKFVFFDKSNFLALKNWKQLFFRLSVDKTLLGNLKTYQVKVFVDKVCSLSEYSNNFIMKEIFFSKYCGLFGLFYLLEVKKCVKNKRCWRLKTQKNVPLKYIKSWSIFWKNLRCGLKFSFKRYLRLSNKSFWFFLNFIIWGTSTDDNTNDPDTTNNIDSTNGNASQSSLTFFLIFFFKTFISQRQV